MSTFHLFSAGCAGVHTGFAIGFRAQLTLARQSETVRSTTGLGGRHDADQDSGNIAGFGRRFFVARGRNPGANRAAGDADGAGVAALGDRGIRAAPYQAAADAPARLSALRTGTRRRLSPVLSRPQCGAGLQRNLRAGIPAERHGDRASHELLLAPRLVWPLLGADQPAPTTSVDAPWTTTANASWGNASGARTPAGALRRQSRSCPQQAGGGESQARYRMAYARRCHDDLP